MSSSWLARSPPTYSTSRTWTRRVRRSCGRRTALSVLPPRWRSSAPSAHAATTRSSPPARTSESRPPPACASFATVRPPPARLRIVRDRPSHTMIAHTLFPMKKRIFFSVGRVDGCIDRFLCYATSEERNLVERLSVPAGRVQRIAYHADQRFFRPFEAPPEPDLICSAGQLLRDYPTLIEAVRGAPVRLRIAAGSPWIAEDLKPGTPLPSNVEWEKYSRFDLRALYARSAVCVVPIQENDYQTGISTILEMMAMGKCVIATRTRGQTDTLVDGVNGIYVPPGDPAALRAAIVRALDRPEETARIGAAARRYIEENATLDLFVERVAAATLGSRAKDEAARLAQ